jgi:taurine dioxygenase
MDVEILPTKAGAILHGLDLAAPLSDSAFKDVYDTYLQWANIVITGQDHISPDDYIAFCARFGEIIPGIPSTSRQKKYSEADIDEAEAPKYTLSGHPEIFVISNLERQGKPVGLSKAGLYWHSDLYYMAEPAKVTFLHGKALPKSGGETLFLNAYEVFEAMPEDLKDRARGVRMWHSWTTGWPYAFPTRAPLSPEDCATTPDIEHPLVGIHPENGRPFLYPGALYDFDNPGIKPMGMDEEEGSALYEELKAFALSDRFIHRHKWNAGDILACDDLAAMHCATPFDDTAELRILHRVTIKGVAPGGA